VGQEQDKGFNFNIIKFLVEKKLTQNFYSALLLLRWSASELGLSVRLHLHLQPSCSNCNNTVLLQSLILWCYHFFYKHTHSLQILTYFTYHMMLSLPSYTTIQCTLLSFSFAFHVFSFYSFKLYRCNNSHYKKLCKLYKNSYNNWKYCATTSLCKFLKTSPNLSL